MFKFKLKIFLAVFTILTTSAVAQEAKKINANIDKELTIGADLDASKNYILGQPTDIAIDTEENIFIADQGSMNIKVYDKNGNFLRVIGKRGRGPGEFLSLSSINFKDNVLQVVDAFGYRITEFNAKGEVLNTFRIASKSRELIFTKQIKQLKNDNNLALYKVLEVPNQTTYIDELFHVWDNEFENKFASFGSFNDLNYKNGFEKEVGRVHVGSISMKEDEKLIFAPNMYKGTIYSYTKGENSWSFEKEVTGYKKIPHPTTEEINSSNNIDNTVSLNTPNGRFQGIIKVTSAGLFVLKSGETVHFTFIKRDDDWSLGVELFDDQMNFKGYTNLKSDIKISSVTKPVIKAKGDDGKFYILSRQNNVPVVHRFSLNFEEL